MATARFIAGPVARNRATASGSTTPEVATGMSSFSDALSIAGSDASELCVLIATAITGALAAMKRPSRTRPPIAASG